MSVALSVLTPSAPGYEQAVEQVAALRITVFREWPYLYDGSVDYEARYLSAFAASDGVL